MINNKAPVKFHQLRPFHLPEKRRLKIFLRDLMNNEKKDFDSLDYIFCDDAFLLKINQDFLHHNDLTDIITFDLAEKHQYTKGEVYISVERVRDNASDLKVAFQEELHRVIFHGALHLCGYTDKTGQTRKQKREKEDFYLSSYFK